jgi:hypothetical protein
MTLIEKIVAIHRALATTDLPYAFGGALALAWCTQQARGTIDIDINVFAGIDRVPSTLQALPRGIAWTSAEVSLLERDGQARLWWDTTPIDIFFNTTEFHATAALRARVEPFEGEAVPFLACRDLAVFKAFFNRTKDWADLEAMADAGSLDVAAVLGVLISYLGPDDERVARLRTIRT